MGGHTEDPEDERHQHNHDNDEEQNVEGNQMEDGGSEDKDQPPEIQCTRSGSMIRKPAWLGD